jgi:hypothetical protein
VGRYAAAWILALRDQDLLPPVVPAVVLVECLQGHAGRDATRLNRLSSIPERWKWGGRCLHTARVESGGVWLRAWLIDGLMGVGGIDRDGAARVSARLFPANVRRIPCRSPQCPGDRRTTDRPDLFLAGREHPAGFGEEGGFALNRFG